MPLIIECVRNPNPLRDELLLNHQFVLGPEGGLAVPLHKPGLGVEINMKVLEEFTVMHEEVKA